jgi:hypothetical protein
VLPPRSVSRCSKASLSQPLRAPTDQALSDRGGGLVLDGTCLADSIRDRRRRAARTHSADRTRRAREPLSRAHVALQLRTASPLRGFTEPKIAHEAATLGTVCCSVVPEDCATVARETRLGRIEQWLPFA